MREKLKQSAKSSNFWNNISTIASLITLAVLISFVEDQETVKEMILAYMSSSGFHNAGNILSHVNKD